MKQSDILFENDDDGFIHFVDTDESVADDRLLDENPEEAFIEEEDLEHWNMTVCPKCRGKFDLTTCRTSGENIICPHCRTLL